MKKSLILIHTLTLLLTSCANFFPTSKVAERSPAAINSSCTNLMKSFLIKKDASAEQIASTLRLKLNMDLHPGELSDFFQVFKKDSFPENELSTLRAIFLFTRNDGTKRRILLQDFYNQLNNTALREKKEWNTFIAHKKNVDIKKKKFSTTEKGLIFEKLYYSCKAHIKEAPTSAQLRQAKHLTYAFMAGSFGSTLVTYSAVHWEEEKNRKWFNELYFSLGLGLALSAVSGKFILAKPNLNPWTQKMPLAFLNNTISDAGITSFYGFLFSTRDAELEKKLKDLQTDPEAQKKLYELLEIAEEEKLFDKHLKNAQALFKDKQTLKSIDREITFDDIDLEESRELLMSALAEKEYREEAGLLVTGSVPTDRFTFHRIYNIFSVPSNIGLSILMHNQMCMTEDPKKGFTKAVATYLAGSIIMDAVYYWGREKAINR